MIWLMVWVILFYLVYKLVLFFFNLSSNAPQQQVHGQSQSQPLDLSDSDVEDVDFKELPK